MHATTARSSADLRNQTKLQRDTPSQDTIILPIAKPSSRIKSTHTRRTYTGISPRVQQPEAGDHPVPEHPVRHNPLKVWTQRKAPLRAFSASQTETNNSSFMPHHDIHTAQPES